MPGATTDRTDPQDKCNPFKTFLLDLVFLKMSTEVFTLLKYIQQYTNAFILLIHLNNGFILVRGMVDPRPLPGTLGTRWEYTLDETAKQLKVLL